MGAGRRPCLPRMALHGPIAPRCCVAAARTCEHRAPAHEGWVKWRPSVLLFAGLDKNLALASGTTSVSGSGLGRNGTAAGTSEISVAGVGSEGLFGLPPASPYFAASPDGRVLFSGIDAKGDTNLWVTNGTSAGTSEISLAKQDPGGLNPAISYRVRQQGAVRRVGQKPPRQSVGHRRHSGRNFRDFRHGQHTQSFVPRDFTVLGSKVLFDGQDYSATTTTFG